MGKYYTIGGIIIGAAALGIGFYFWRTTETKPQSVTPSSNVQAVATSTFATTTYTLIYPADFSKNELYAYDQFGPKKLIHGVKFMIPDTMATGTNLSAVDTGVSVEQLPHAKNCTGDIFIAANVKAHTMTDGSLAYSVATTSGVGAGNLYEEEVYAVVGSHPCTALRYFIHSSNIANYTPGAVREFDRAGLVAAFDTIRRSIQMIPRQ